MNFDHYEFTVAEHFVSAIINGDESALDDDESEALEYWTDNLPNVNMNFQIEDDSEDYGICEICNEYARVVKIRGYFPVNQSEAA